MQELVELDIHGNGGVELPKSLAALDDVKILMGDNSLKLPEQARLRAMFPRVTFDFANEFDSAGANEESVN